MSLDSLRSDIDSIDKRIVALLNQRAALAKKSAWKKARLSVRLRAES